MGAFGRKLKELREAKGMTQHSLAEASGLHRVQIAKLEGSQHVPSWDTVQALAAALGVDCKAFQDRGKSKKEKKPAAKRQPKK